MLFDTCFIVEYFFILVNMDHMQITDQVSASQQKMVIDEKKFLEFMQQVPVWNFAKISQNHYLTYLREAKTDLIQKYYSYMLNQSVQSGNFLKVI